MKKIRMVDLQSQYIRHKEEIDQAISLVLESTAFIKGPVVREFEEELAGYLDVKHCISCGNGTDALQVAMMGLELEPGDEVITTPFTFIATIEVISLLKLKPIIADVDPFTFNIDPQKIRKQIGPRTKAIVPVHLFGQVADMKNILALAQEFGLYIIEDNAQAIGADYTFPDGSTRKAGTLGNIGCTSFFPSKNLGAYGDGGAMFTDNEELATKIRSMVNHGMGERYYYEHVGVNSRLDSIQAAILRVKLKYLDTYARNRQEVASAYDAAFDELANVSIPARNPDSNHMFHQYTLKINDGSRDQLKAYLASKEIPAMIYYPVPLHLQNAYKELQYKKGDFPVAEKLCEEVISLPIHTEMEAEQLDYIISNFKDFYS